MPRRRRGGSNISRLSRSQNYYRQHQNLNDDAGTFTLPLHSAERNVEFRHLQSDFENDLRNLKLYKCNNCFRVLMQIKEFNVCAQCKKNPNKFTAANNMNPGNVPLQLQDLTFVEQLLIAKIQPVMRVYRVKSRGIPGQYAYTGNIINIGQNINEIINLLPRTPSTLSVVIIRREVSNEYRDFHVRRNKVLAALHFLKNNNPYYADIEIDMQKISQLPIDGNISDQLQSVQMLENAEILDEDSNLVYESVIPENIRLRETERIQSEIDNVVPWPQSTDIINEFTCEGYITMAFPTLFPYGKAELNDNTRPNGMKVTVLEYFQFLMEYEDSRFARDPRFRYFALNTVQRHDAIKRGTIFAKKSHFNGTIQQLKETMTNNPHIVKSLYYWSSKIRGSNSYWYQRRNELEAMINQIGLPTGFLTFSAADLWWTDLARLLGYNFERQETLNESQIAQQRQKLINENPKIVEDYFTFRATTFIDKVLCKRYPIVDYWFRYEFQHRGSCHLHGVFWFSEAPDARQFDNASAEQLLSAKKYYDQLVSAFNPLPSTPAAPIHPSRIRSTDVDINDDRSVSELLNRFQRHTQCTKGYCLRWNGTQFVCRFKFPKELQQESTLQKDDKGRWVYTPLRNDAKLNQYNLFIAQTWRANTDFQIITSEHAVVNYIAKYASKSEPASTSLMEMFQEIVESRNDNDESRHAYTRLMMKIIGERDIGACETCHILQGIPLYQATRTFQVLVIRLEEYITINGTDNDDTSSSFIEFYCKRPPNMENLTLHEFAKKHYKRGNSVSTSRKEKIVQVFPKVDRNIDSNIELFSKQQLMLHVPWRSQQNLKNDDESWKTAFERSGIFLADNLHMSLFSPEENEQTVRNDDQEILFNERDWMVAAAAMPNALPAYVSLGNRDIDILHNWNAAFYKYPDVKNNIQFIEQCRETVGDSNTNLSSSNITFNNQQNSILSFLNYQLLNYENCLDKLVIIQGKAGTGKSCVINEMVHRINAHYGTAATLLMAPTGVAANNINGQTLHSALRIYPLRNFEELRGESKLSFEDELQNINFIIIDEASMLGLNLFYKVDLRLREAKPQLSHLPFGGLCVYLIGDWSQLPPVCDMSLYNIGKNHKTIQSSLLYSQFKKVFFLTEIMRQSGEEQRLFRDTLNRISIGSTTEIDYQLLSTRFFVNNLNDKSFENAVCIMSKNADIEKFNYDKLESNKQPVALIKAIHNCPEAALASPDEAQGLFSELRLCKGARIILRRNLWVSKGLANGSVGTVTDIIYDPSVECEVYSDCMPLCILVKFEKYSGPTLYGDSIPIMPIISSFKRQETSCTRKQFPVMLGYAVSIHRSQGITIDKAIVDIGSNEFQVGLTYVALSRVKTLDGLLIKPSFNLDRLLTINNSNSMRARRDELQRLWNIANNNN